jgi:hypothetical protein
MITLASMFAPMVDGTADPLERVRLEQALAALTNVDAEVVGFEAANKSLPQIRRRAERDVPCVLTKGGRPDADESSAVVISVGQLVQLFARIVAIAEADAAERKPADAILERLVPIGGHGRSIDVRLRREEETVGGRNRF